MDQLTRRIVGFAVHRGVVDGTTLCRMFNRAVHTQTLPKYLSSDHDPLYRFHQRLIGTVRREYLDQTLFWTAADLEEKLRAFQDYFNRHRVHSGLEGRLPEPDASAAMLDFDSYRWQRHCRGLFQTPVAA